MQPNNDFKPVRPLPPELYEHCVILLEEKMYNHVLSLLHSLIHDPHKIATPPPSMLRLLSTLTVHPSTTSRLQSVDFSFLDVLNYLTTLIDRVGSEAARLPTAFLFSRAHAEISALGVHGDRKPHNRPRQLGTPTTRTSSTDSDGDVSEDDSPDDRIHNRLASDGSLFSAAEGFWPTVGWALNTSVKYAHRWTYWKHWLAFILHILESELPSPDDTADQILEGTKNSQANPILITSSSPNESNPSAPSQNLGSQYLREVDLHSWSEVRKILRAVFADGSDASLSEFHETWAGETKLPKEKEATPRSSRSKLDLDEGQFGDYWDDEDDEQMEVDSGITIKQEGKPRTSGRTARQRGKYAVKMNLDDGLERSDDASTASGRTETTDPIAGMGGIESLQLRRRILVWITNALLHQENGVALLRDFLNLVAEFLRPLPLPVFTFLVAPAPMGQTDFADVTMARLHTSLLHVLLSGTHAPAFQFSLPTQGVLQHWYLPLNTTSNHVEDVARASLVLEGLLRVVWRNGALLVKHVDALEEATEKGIGIRQKKVDASTRRGSTKVSDGEARAAIAMANARMKMILDAVRNEAGDALG